MQLYNEMYVPSDWNRFMQETYPQIVETVKGEASTNVTLYRRSEHSVRSNDLCVELSSRVRCECSSRALLCRLLKRATANGSPSYSPQAIYCGDAIDTPGVTMEDEFKGLIDTARNVSHMCG